MQKCPRTQQKTLRQLTKYWIPSAVLMMNYFSDIQGKLQKGYAITFLQSSGDAASSALGQDLPACYIIYAEQIAWQLRLKYNHSAICTCSVKRQKFFKALIP